MATKKKAATKKAVAKKASKPAGKEKVLYSFETVLIPTGTTHNFTGDAKGVKLTPVKDHKVKIDVLGK